MKRPVVGCIAGVTSFASGLGLAYSGFATIGLALMLIGIAIIAVSINGGTN